MKASWIHILATIGVAVLGAVTPVFQSAISAHPTVALVLGSVWGILGAFLKPPTQ